MKQKAGGICLYKKARRIRGCIGTFIPSCENVAGEIIRNAICAATQDPRFHCVEKEELSELSYSVDVLTPPEEVKNLKELDPQKHGVNSFKRAEEKDCFCPDLEGVDTVEEQLRIAKMKAGIYDNEEVKIFRFEVKRYK